MQKKTKTYKIKSEVWIWPGEKAAWHFASVDKRTSEKIIKAHGTASRGWGSLPVVATILQSHSGQVGKTNWKTSIFPDRKSGTYLLPLKADVRKREGIQRGDTITFVIKVSA